MTEKSSNEGFSIQSSIFFQTRFRQEKHLTTPFGDIYVTVNGEAVSFHHRKESYKTTGETSDKIILMDIIDIDLSGLKVGDLIWCGFNKDILEYNDGDERSIIYSCEDENQILGLCAYEPDQGQEYYCYSLYEFDGKGFCYLIEAEPRNYDEKKFYLSKYVSLAVAWLDKIDFKDADTELFLALTNVIG